MNDVNCDYVRDALPDLLMERGSENRGTGMVHAPQLRAHLAACDDCRAEAAVLELLSIQRVTAPSGLEARVVSALAQPQPRARVPRHVLALAASVAIALVGGSVLLQVPRSTADPVVNVRVYGFVGVEEAMLSGKASLNDLSEEELEMLLLEMES